MILLDKNQLLFKKTFTSDTFLLNIRRLSTREALAVDIIVGQHLQLKRTNSNSKQYISQTTLAKKIGVGRQRMNVILSSLREEGLISWWKRPGKQTCLYEINPLFFDSYIQQRLASFFKCFALTFLLLLSAPIRPATQLNIQGYIKNLIVSITKKKRVQKRPRFEYKPRRYVMSPYEPKPFPPKNESSITPPSHKPWEPDIIPLEDPFVAAQNFQKIKDDVELMETCRRLGFLPEIKACCNNSYKNLLEENLEYKKRKQK